MFEREISKYKKLNDLAEHGGTVILGCGKDVEIPVAELTAAFEIGTRIYNRSAAWISVKNAETYYNAVIRPLYPARLILHIGAFDAEMVSGDASKFDRYFGSLIKTIRSTNPKCSIGVVSFVNKQGDQALSKVNRHLRMIAESERCAFEDISTPRIWNPEATKCALSFASAMGLSPKILKHKSLYDLSKILFCLDANGA